MLCTCRLRRNFKEGPKSGPSLVRVQFSDVHQMMREAFPGDKPSSVEVARLLTSMFPSCEAKRDTKGKKEMFYIGLERKPCESDRQPKPGTSATAQDITVLPVEIQLSHERSLNQLLTSLERLDSFTLAEVIRDVKRSAPNLYSLLCDLGDTSRNASDKMITTHEEVKVITSVCVLPNARSRRIKGVQLFLSIMLIARAVNKQVCKDIDNTVTGTCISNVTTTCTFRHYLFSTMLGYVCLMT